MRLFEYQGKALLKGHGIAIPASRLITSPAQAAEAFEELPHPVMIKAQVLVGGRGKAGGVVEVGSAQEAEREAARVLGLEIGGEAPRSLLLEEAVPHEGEMYLSVALDRGERTFVVVASASGGMDVESLGGKVIEPIPLDGLTEAIADSVAARLSLQGRSANEFLETLLNLEGLSREEECELAEINPLAVCPDGALKALDSKIVLDDNALFRHPELSQFEEKTAETAAAKEGFAFVALDGDTAVIGNGAGLVLSTMDLLSDAGGKAACFLDLGGGAERDRVEAALELASSLPSARRILINIFGGITRTTDVAAAIKSVTASGMAKPVYARISGAGEDEARAMLEGTSSRLFSTTEEAVEAAVRG